MACLERGESQARDPIPYKGRRESMAPKRWEEMGRRTRVEEGVGIGR